MIAAVLAVMFLSASARRREEAASARRDSGRIRSAARAGAAPSPVVAELPQQRQTRVTALATVLGQRVAWDRLLREVSQVVPSDVWLSR